MKCKVVAGASALHKEADAKLAMPPFLGWICGHVLYSRAL